MHTSNGRTRTPPPITVVGGGIAGLVASIACAEAGARNVQLLEAHARLGGAARSSEPPWVANLGPHALYTTTGLWEWLQAKELLPPVVTPSATQGRFRWQGRRRAVPPVPWRIPAVRDRLASAPVDESFRAWAARHFTADVVTALCGVAGVLTFDHDPGRLAAAFVAEKFLRIVMHVRPVARYVVGGWSNLVASLERGARERGVAIRTGERVDTLPEDGPVIVAAGGTGAARLLGDQALQPRGTRTALLDIGMRHGRNDPSAVVDLDRGGFATRVTSVDPTMAPRGCELVQLLVGVEEHADLAQGVAELESLLDDTFRGWRERELWRRRSIVEHRSGAVDLPGQTWRDRPAVDRGDGVFVCGDQVAAPGHLAEVAWASALQAAAGAVRVVDRTAARSA